MAILPLKLFPHHLNFDFLGKRWFGFSLSFLVIMASFVSLATRGLNLGIDFTGGVVIEAQFKTAPDLTKLRLELNKLDLGDVSLQQLGEERNILIRVGGKKTENQSMIVAVKSIKTTLETHYGSDIEYRKTDYVGPKVGGELMISGAIAVILSIIGIMIYLAFRFEWRFGVGAVMSLLHDAIATLGFYSWTHIEFNVSSIAVILTIVGYSINDTVVIFDRIRENLRKYKSKPIDQLLNLSINDCFIRTILTTATTFIALVVLTLLGGEVVRGFSTAALFGVFIGCFSTIYIAAPVLLYTNFRPTISAPTAT